MNLIEGQYNFQDELDRAPSRDEALKKEREAENLLQQEKAQKEAQQLEEIRQKELERLKELDEKDNPREEYYERFAKFKKR
jgi:hypothetical protein